MRKLVGEEGKVIIGLNRDEYIRDFKKRQPLSNWAERKRALLLTREVNHVEGFYCNPIDLIMFFKPDYIFVGSDRTEKEVIGHEECKQWGGKVVIIERLLGISTTAIIAAQKLNKPLTGTAEWAKISEQGYLNN
jgi:bifunctional ADP-heptose synthase (sugar kinase/adenylyltransferase)